MERTTFSVLFFIRRTRLNKLGEAPIQMRITVNGVRSDSAVKKFILPCLWSTAKGRAIPRNRECKEINMYLDAVKLRLMQHQREMEVDGVFVTADELLDRFNGVGRAKRRTIVEIFREHNDKSHKLAGVDMSPATVERYETSLKHTVEFMQHAYHKDDICLDDIDHKYITDYEFYLKTERKCSHNTATKYLKNFKKIIRIALANEWMKKDPFANIKFTLDDVERDFLEEHELQIIMDKEFVIQRLEYIRDAFVFSCFTGLAFSDLKGLREEHIVTDNDGAMWIRKRRQKTKNMCNIPLLDIPLHLLQKYKDHPACGTKGELLPVPSNQKMNAYLREIADVCGIQKDISTHTGRYTFATVTCLSNGISMESVAKMLGHSDTKMTRHYAKVLDRTIINEMKNIQGKYKGEAI